MATTNKPATPAQKFKSLTLDDLTGLETGSIYITNTSKKENPNGADVFITVYVGNQSVPTIISVPLSWKPFNLTEQAPRAAILGSQHFLKAVATGVLTLMSSEEAQSILATPSGIRETERVAQLKARVEAAIRNPNADDFKLTIEGQEDDTQQDRDIKHSLSASFFDEDAVSTSFKAWVNKNNSVASEDAVNAAKIRGEFSTDELQYYLDNTTHNRIRKGLKTRLQGLSKSAE